MQVLKFGGTSVGSSNAIRLVLEIIKSKLKKSESLNRVNNTENHIIIVCSAMSGITNKLLMAGELAKKQEHTYANILQEVEETHLDVIYELLPIKAQSNVILQLKLLLNKLDDILHGVFLLQEFSPKTQDLVLSFGEQMSCYIINEYLKQNKINTKYIDSRTLIKTNNDFNNAIVDFKTTNTILNDFAKNLKYIPIVTGFIASTLDNETTTLGRGGSDYTAAIIGAGVTAEIIEIWTDVDGVMTTDPKQVESAYTIPYLSYQEAMELSHFGAKIIYSQTLYPAFKNKIPLAIKNTFNPKNKGTLISEKPIYIDTIVKGIMLVGKN